MSFRRYVVILIVGGAGYIGSHVNKELSRRGLQTLVFDNLVTGHREFAKWGTFVEGDLAHPGQLRAAFREYPIQAVMHFSAFAYVGESVENPSRYYRNNVINTLNLLEVMREFRVRQFIFSSSCATYGNPVRIPIDEAHPQAPISPYGHTKLMVERILRDCDHAYGLRYASLRYFNAAGADPESEIGEWHDPETHLIPLVLDAASGRRENVRIFGSDYDTPDGTCVRDYIHVADLADAHIRALEYLQNGGGSDVFNLGNGNGFSVKEVVREAEKVTGAEIPSMETARRAGDPPVLVGSSEKIRKTLGWEPKFASLSDIIKTAWAWHQNMPGRSNVA